MVRSVAREAYGDRGGPQVAADDRQVGRLDGDVGTRAHGQAEVGLRRVDHPLCRPRACPLDATQAREVVVLAADVAVLVGHGPWYPGRV